MFFLPLELLTEEKEETNWEYEPLYLEIPAHIPYYEKEDEEASEHGVIIIDI